MYENSAEKHVNTFISGSKEYVSDGIPGKHSPFEAKFIQALREVGTGDGSILTLGELNLYFEKLTTEPRFGGFGSDDPASDCFCHQAELNGCSGRVKMT